MNFGQKIKAFLGISDDAQQLTEQQAQQLEVLAETNQNLTTANLELKNKLDEISNLFPNSENLLQSIQETKSKAESFDKNDGSNQHRLDKEDADGNSNSEVTLEQTLNSLPHHKNLIENKFYN